MQYQLITTFEHLEKVCEAAQRQEAVALDTEFVRTKTLTPHLGLLHVQTDATFQSRAREFAIQFDANKTGRTVRLHLRWFRIIPNT